MKIDTFYPFLCGAVIAALVCFFTFPSEILAPVKAEIAAPVELLAPAEPLALVEPPIPDSLVIPAFWDGTEERNSVADFYRNGGSRDDAFAFFAELLCSRELAAAIFDNAEAFDIAPSLAAALCWVESRFKIRAVNQKNLNGTIDRGLFQLNSATFPNLTEQEFFNPHTNAYYGMSHLRWCLDSGGSVVAGLAMYNAGTNRVFSGGAPKRTLDYIAGILTVQEQIEQLFANYSRELESRRAISLAAAVEVEEEPPAAEPELPRQRLALLRPISGRY